MFFNFGIRLPVFHPTYKFYNIFHLIFVVLKELCYICLSLLNTYSKQNVLIAYNNTVLMTNWEILMVFLNTMNCQKLLAMANDSTTM